MERRFLLFLILSFLVLMANALWNAQQAAKLQQQRRAAEAARQQDAPAEEPAELDAPRADGAEEEDDAPRPDAPETEPAPEVEFVTLGSVDPVSPFRMGVTITNAGAAVRRLELSNPRYLDMHDRGGYLGHLELLADGQSGLLVRAVVAGTPAAAAGIEAGDRLLAAGEDARPLVTPQDLVELLADTRPNRKFKLVVRKSGGAEETLTVPLRRRPLEVIRPESENYAKRGEALPPDFQEPPSFQATLAQFDQERLAWESEELPGLDLSTAPWTIVDRSDDSVTFQRRLPRRGLTITKRYRLASLADAAAAKADEPAYHLTLELTIANDAEDGGAERRVAYRLDGPNSLPTEGWWFVIKVGRASGAGLRDVQGRYFGASPVQQTAAGISAGDAPPFESGAMAYMGGDSHYFAAAMLPDKEDPKVEWIASSRSRVVGPVPSRRSGRTQYANVSFRMLSHPVTLQPGEEVTHAYRIFAGPKRPGLLKKYVAAGDPAYTLGDFVYYGWFSGIARLMVGALHVFYSLVGNYGVAIVMLTILVRGCMFPISRSQVRSMAKLQELRPEMDRIKERYKGDSQKQAQAMQQLYRKHKVNPLAGCLPVLLQLPIFVGLWRGLSVDVELRQAPLLGGAIRWCSNLAAPDMLYNWSSWMPSLVTNYLGPYLNVLPLVTVALFLLQQKMFMPPPVNEQAAMQQKIMKYMMVLIGVLFYKVPSGLCLYSISSSLWGMGERKLFPPPPAPDAAAAPGPASSSSPSRPGRDAGASEKNGAAARARDKKAKRRR